jgi:hypothetical protein
MWANFSSLYNEARREGWEMPTGKPTTIGWLWGYFQGYTLGSDAVGHCPFEQETLAWNDWMTGYRNSMEDYGEYY